MAKSRKVGQGRGGVFAGGTFYPEGAEIPADVEVGDHVFDDVDDVVGNVPAGPNVAFGAALSTGNAEQAEAAQARDDAAASTELTVEELQAQAGVEPPTADAPAGESKSRKSSS